MADRRAVLLYGWWEIWVVPLLGSVILFNFGIGRAIQSAADRPVRPHVLLAAGIAANLALLFYFNYAAFFVTALR